MRPNLHILSERRRSRVTSAPTRRTSGPTHRALVERPGTPAPARATATLHAPLRRRADQTRLDLDAQRVRESGGPRDNALYSCSCGFVFDAAVSTTVACPNCGDQQAW